MTAMQVAQSPRQILAAAAPIGVAVFVFGVSFGVLAIAAHLPGWSVVLMSVLVFAGSAQFATVGILTTGGGVIAAVLAGALLNLRYIATGIASARSLPGNRWLRALFAQLVVDESYVLAVSAGEAGRPDRRTLLVVGVFLYSAWVVGTLLGVLVGPIAGDPKRLGLDAAFPALFIALLWPLLKGRHAVRCAIGGALAALVLAPLTPPGVPLAGAALVGLWLAH